MRGPHAYQYQGKTHYAFPDGLIDGPLLGLTEQDPGGPVTGWVDKDTKAARWMMPGVGDRWPYRIAASLQAGFPLFVATYDGSGKALRSRLYIPHVPPCTVPDIEADIKHFLDNIGHRKLYQGRDLKAEGLSMLVSAPTFLSSQDTLGPEMRATLVSTLLPCLAPRLIWLPKTTTALGK